MPVPLTRIVMRQIRKPPEARFQSALDLVWALEQLERGQPSVEGAQWLSPGGGRGWPRVRTVGWLAPAIAAVVLLSVGAVTWQAWRMRDNAAPPRAVPLTSLPGVERYPSLSPDGNLVAFTWNGPKGDNGDIYVQQIGAGPPLRLTMDPAADYSPAWSPDGRWIAFLRDQPGSGGNEVPLSGPLGGRERKRGDTHRHARVLRGG